MEECPVYREPLKAYKVVSNQSKGRLYEVAFGEVDWGKNGETEFAVYVRIHLLINGHWIPQNYPAHILVVPSSDGRSDYDLVTEKLEKLRQEYLQ